MWETPFLSKHINVLIYIYIFYKVLIKKKYLVRFSNSTGKSPRVRQLERTHSLAVRGDGVLDPDRHLRSWGSMPTLSLV